jgi:ferredoxin
LTRSVLILGAGAAAAAAALALTRDRGLSVTVLDIGETLPPVNRDAQQRLSIARRDEWSEADLRTVTEQPAANSIGGLPEKRTYGSAYPFQDVGQRAGLTALDEANEAVVSGAYGGFTNVWGAQLMPFTAATFRDWPVSSADMGPAYAAILNEIPLAGEEDDLADLFPLLAPSKPLPPLSERTRQVLHRYDRYRPRLNRRGVSVGRARLALDSRSCVRCGLCMTGCPYSLIYSAAHTLTRLQQSQQITYHRGLLVSRIEEHDDGVTVLAREIGGTAFHRFTADRAFVACGAIGSTRLVMGSLELFDEPVSVAESTQFVLPFLSARPVPDPRAADDFTLNQFNMVVDLDGGHDVSQLHFYNYNPAFLDNLPAVLRRDRAEPVRRSVLRRLTVALGYLPSWAAPTFELTARKPADSCSLPDLELTAGPAGFRSNRFLRQVLGRVTAVAPALDLWPALPVLSMSKPGKSYHWGATFPHTTRPNGPFSSDVLGRVGGWRRVHMVDAAVFPTVPATTFTLTIMANAYRIADTVRRELSSP